MNNLNIALVGKAGSGKSTISNYLVKKYNFEQEKLANPIYKIAQEYFNMTKKDRKLLQFIGNGFRALNKDIWINHLIKRINEKKEIFRSVMFDLRFVIDDCRFENEFNILKENGFIIIGLKCPDEIRMKRLEKRDGTTQCETLNDISETEMNLFIDKCDYYINTSGSYDDNYIQLEETMEAIKNATKNRL